ncbi:uncharacterized protein BJ212DRAFT_1480436 [Suillus subaureus]|uniref:Uncharacterized protein n=1 Tax=Suillus subaureus TaxID=48587 RepID=A0A9P7JDT1_9AGAM|nr:uncharacterized protein BJ212DRAFT_1480436 [Suillus subaureus]KAG1817207.1 hypothetical protein BJ212DRAFT_1480436 [Suillus subaureus]
MYSSLSPTGREWLIAAMISQTAIWTCAWIFIIEVWRAGVLVLPDHIVHLIVEHPTVLTLVVTLTSTTLSIITSFISAFAIKEALCAEQLELRMAMETQTSHAVGPNAVGPYVGPHAVGPQAVSPLAVGPQAVGPHAVGLHVCGLSDVYISGFEVCTILNELNGDMFDAGLYSWSTFLLPTLVQWPVAMFGTELDLGSIAFVNLLNTDLNAPGASTAQTHAFQNIDVLTLLSGIAAVNIQEGVQTNSMFSFNGVSYNQSTGGVLPAIEEYSGSSKPPGSAIGLAFSGGRVPNYTVTQQGLTANVSCQPIDHSQNSFSIYPISTVGPNITFYEWQAVANCSGNTNGQYYFTVGNVSGQVGTTINGFLPTVVCPSPGSMTSDQYKFDVFMNGQNDYSFLPTTVCEVVPYLTTVDVTYNGGIISVDRINVSTSSPGLPLFQYISTVMAYQATTNQGMTTNPIGNFLAAYGADNVSVMHSELEDYWRGITEFASTQLRSGYSASGVPSNMTRSTSGTMYITTYGWQSQAYTYIFLLFMITVIWIITVSAAWYSLIQRKRRKASDPSDDASDPFFNFSDPIDLIIATYCGGLGLQLPNGDKKGVFISEDITVHFQDVHDGGKRIGEELVVTVPPPTATP